MPCFKSAPFTVLAFLVPFWDWHNSLKYRTSLAIISEVLKFEAIAFPVLKFLIEKHCKMKVLCSKSQYPSTFVAIYTVSMWIFYEFSSNAVDRLMRYSTCVLLSTCFFQICIYFFVRTLLWLLMITLQSLSQRNAHSTDNTFYTKFVLIALMLILNVAHIFPCLRGNHVSHPHT